jgi:hypothetical protein
VFLLDWAGFAESLFFPCSFPQLRVEFADFGQNSIIVQFAANKSLYFPLFSGNALQN